MQAFALLAGVVSAGVLQAQGNLSVQGFGYPQGQLTTRALSVGGGIGEIDPTGPLNPAAIGRLITRTVLFQIEPEYRRLTTSAGVDKTTTARYPVILVGVPFGEHWVTSVSSSSLLDRSWKTAQPITEIIGPDTVPTTLNESSDGAINDVRFAAAWTNRDWLSIGVGVHGITGRNVVTSGQDFGDSSHFSAFNTKRTLSYRGSALSAGIELTAGDKAVFGASFRKGSKMKERSNDSTLADATVPDHFGLSAAFIGLRNTTVAVRAGHDKWSSMTGLFEKPGQTVHDSWDIGGGVEAPGPHVFGQTLLLRGGYRDRTLPFEAESKMVTERTGSFGTGIALSGGRVLLDVAALHQWRTSDVPSITERAWTLSFSITARP
jgi:hypothetical protein